VSKAAQTRSTLSHGGFAESVVCSEIREGNDPALGFSGCVGSCLVVREAKGKVVSSAWSIGHARGRSKGLELASRFYKNVAAVREERRGQKMALSDTLSAGRGRDGGEHAGQERSRGRRRSGRWSQ